jgi:hypothetical protein
MAKEMPVFSNKGSLKVYVDSSSGTLARGSGLGNSTVFAFLAFARQPKRKKQDLLIQIRLQARRQITLPKIAASVKPRLHAECASSTAGRDRISDFLDLTFTS